MRDDPRENVALGVALMTLTQAFCVAAIFGVPVLAPAIAPSLGVEPTLVGVFVAAVYGISTIASAPGGAAAARYGAFAVSIGCLAISALGAASAATGLWVGLLFAAVVFGIAGGAETPASSHLLSRLVPRERQARLFSIRQTGNQIGAITASLSMPVLAAAFGWRIALLFLAALCVVGALILLAARTRFARSDAPANAGQAPGSIESLRLVWSTPALRNISIAAFTFCAMQLCLNGYMTTYATSELGMSLAMAGVLLAVAQTAGLVGRFSMGFVVEKVGATRSVLIGLGFLMSVAALTTAVFSARWPWVAMLVTVALFGVSASGWNGIFYAELARVAPAGRIAEATGGGQFIAYAGLIAGPLLFGLVAKATGSMGLGYAVIALFTLAGALFLTLAREGRG